MSRMADESKGVGKQKNGPAKSKPKKSLFVSVHLVSNERDRIKAGLYGINEAIDRIEGYIGSGHSLKVKMRGDGNGYAATLSEGDVNWDEAVNLSAFHNSVSNALIVLGMGLEERFEHFPRIQLDMLPEEWEF